MTSSNKIPILSTARLCLRPFDLSDANDVQRLAGDPAVAATTATIPHPYPDGVAEAWISKHADSFDAGTLVTWAIETIEDRQLVGCMSLVISKKHRSAEIAYWVGAPFWNKGFCTEAAREATRYAFMTLNLNKLTSRHLARNPSSGRVMQKIGMKQEGYLEQEHLKDGVFEDIVAYGLLRRDFVSSKGPLP